MPFIYTKNRAEKRSFPDLVAVVKSALEKAVVEGADPEKEVTEALTSAGVEIVDLRGLFEAPPEHLKSTSKSDFQRLSRAVHRAFTKLEKQGFFAAENFGHCADCAGRDVFKNAAAGNKPKCVLYTSTETAQMQSTGVCIIRYGVSYHIKSEYAHKAKVREVGREVAKALADAGLAVEWDDDPETAIKARLKEE